MDASTIAIIHWSSLAESFPEKFTGIRFTCSFEGKAHLHLRTRHRFGSNCEFDYKIRLTGDEYKQLTTIFKDISIPVNMLRAPSVLDGYNNELVIEDGDCKLHVKWNAPPPEWKKFDEQILAIFEEYTSPEFFRRKKRTDPDLPFVLAIADQKETWHRNDK